MQRLDALIAQVAGSEPDLSVITTALFDLRTHLDDSRPDLAPVAQRLDQIDGLVRHLDDNRPDLTPLHEAVEQLQSTLGRSVHDDRATAERTASAIEAVHSQVLSSRLDPEPLHEALATIQTSLETNPARLDRIDSELEKVLDRLARQAAAQTSTDDLVNQAVDQLRVDLDPVLDAIGDVRRHVDVVRPDLDPMRASIEVSPTDSRRSP